MKRKKSTISVSAIGSCVCRDLFEIPSSHTESGEYKINAFIQSVSPISAISPKPSDELTERLLGELQLSDTTGFYKRNFTIDIKKGAFDYLREKKSDYLIVDFSSNRYELIKIGNSFFTTALFENAHAGIKDGKEAPLLLKYLNTEKTDPLEIGEAELKSYIDGYIDEILKIYPQKRIIFISSKNTYAYLDGNGELFTLSQRTRARYKAENERIRIAQEYARERLGKAHFIDLPDIPVGNSSHKWGVHGMHYNASVYEYLYSAIELITRGKLSRNKEKAAIERLKSDCARLQVDIYTSAVQEYAGVKNNLLPFLDGVCAGIWTRDGLTLTTREDGTYTLCGAASKNTVFYLQSGHKNPLGDWASANFELKAGKYRFTTGVKTDKELNIQLVITDKSNNRRWINGDYSADFSIDGDFVYSLVRVMISEGKSVDLTGIITIERL